MDIRIIDIDITALLNDIIDYDHEARLTIYENKDIAIKITNHTRDKKINYMWNIKNLKDLKIIPDHYFIFDKFLEHKAIRFTILDMVNKLNR